VRSRELFSAGEVWDQAGATAMQAPARKTTGKIALLCIRYLLSIFENVMDVTFIAPIWQGTCQGPAINLLPKT
jgi:hypothetical protein